jgi:hypothetical protein
VQRRPAVHRIDRKITECQIGVFADYVSDKGCAIIDPRLYLPMDWTNTPQASRRQRGGELKFRSAVRSLIGLPAAKAAMFSMVSS